MLDRDDMAELERIADNRSMVARLSQYDASILARAILDIVRRIEQDDNYEQEQHELEG